MGILENRVIRLDGKLTIRKRRGKVSLIELDGVPLHKVIPDFTVNDDGVFGGGEVTILIVQKEANNG